jgi:hypothetical protein
VTIKVANPRLKAARKALRRYPTDVRSVRFSRTVVNCTAVGLAAGTITLGTAVPILLNSITATNGWGLLILLPSVLGALVWLFASGMMSNGYEPKGNVSIRWIGRKFNATRNRYLDSLEAKYTANGEIVNVDTSLINQWHEALAKEGLNTQDPQVQPDAHFELFKEAAEWRQMQTAPTTSQANIDRIQAVIQRRLTLAAQAIKPELQFTTERTAILSAVIADGDNSIIAAKLAAAEFALDIH